MMACQIGDMIIALTGTIQNILDEACREDGLLIKESLRIQLAPHLSFIHCFITLIRARVLVKMLVIKSQPFIGKIEYV